MTHMVHRSSPLEPHITSDRNTLAGMTTEQDTKMTTIETSSPGATLRTELRDAIIEHSNKKVESLLELCTGLNLSDPMIPSVLPRKFHGVAKNVHTTPVRTAVSYKNIEALKCILQSTAIITANDKHLALQKAFRHLQEQIDLDIISVLLKYQARPSHPRLFSKTLANILSSNRQEFAYKVVREVCESSDVTSQGELLIALSTDEAPEQIVSKDIWQKFAGQAIHIVFKQGFDTVSYCDYVLNGLTDRDMYRHLTDIMHLLPYIIRRCPEPSIFLRIIGRAAVLFKRHKQISYELLHLLHRLGATPGVKVRKQLQDAMPALVQRFYDNADKITMALLARNATRKLIKGPNFEVHIDNLKPLPTRLRDFIMAEENGSFFWEPDQVKASTLKTGA